MNTGSEDCGATSAQHDDAHCTRVIGHDGPHVGRSYGETVQWKRDAREEPDTSPIYAWSQLLPVEGSDVSVTFVRRAGTLDGQLVATMYDESGLRAIRLVGADWAAVVRWDAIESLRWYVPDE